MEDYLHDEELSWEAKGILAYVLNQSSNFIIYKKYFYNNFCGGRAKIDKIFSELERLGYLKTISMSQRNKTYKFSSVVENQQRNVENQQQLSKINNEVNAEKQQRNAEKQQRVVENQQLLNVKDNNTPPTPSLKTNKKKKDEVHEILKDWIKKDKDLEEAFEDFITHRKQQGDKLTERSNKMLLKRLQQLSHSNPTLATELLNNAILRNWKTVYSDFNTKEPEQFIKKQKNTDRL